MTRLSEPRASTVSYYQHPALRGCHPFSLELAVNHNRNLSSRIADANQYNRQNNSGKSDSSANSDVEMTIDTLDDRDREIDLSLKPDSNHTRSRSSLDEEKISTSPEHDNSFESSESVEPHQGKQHFIYLSMFSFIYVFSWNVSKPNGAHQIINNNNNLKKMLQGTVHTEAISMMKCRF